MILGALESLSDKDKESFQIVINEFINSTFILKQEFSTKAGRFVPNDQFNFLERHFSLIRDFFTAIGWNMQINERHGFAMVTNPFYSSTVRLTLFQTYFLYMLRYIYEEKENEISLNKGVTCTVREVLIKMIEGFNLISKRPSKVMLDETVHILKKYRVIDSVPEEDWNRQLIVYPTIFSVVTADKIRKIEEKLRNKDSVVEAIESDEEEREV